MNRHGQTVLVYAVLLMVLLTLLAVAVDGGRLFITKSRLRGAMQASGDAGMSWVAEQMVTLAIPRQTEAALLAPCVADGDYGEMGASCTATPKPEEASSWLTDEDRQALTRPEIAATVVSIGEEYARRNGFDANSTDVEALQVAYPYRYSLEHDTLELRTYARLRTEILLVGILGEEVASVESETLSQIPQR